MTESEEHSLDGESLAAYRSATDKFDKDYERELELIDIMEKVWLNCKTYSSVVHAGGTQTNRGLFPSRGKVAGKGI